MMLTPGVFNMAFNYIKRFNHRNRLSVGGGMRCGESLMIATAFSTSEWTFEVDV